jgi:hypothetical protein
LGDAHADRMLARRNDFNGDFRSFITSARQGIPSGT